MKKKVIGLLASLLLLGGCFNLNEKTEQEKAQEGTTPVQDYVGQGFSFVDGDKSEELVKRDEEKIKQEAINYMKTTYKTDVKVNNVVPARNAAVVMIECEEPIQFYTSVIMGESINKKGEWSARSNEGEVEQAIVSGLYEKAYETEFRNLDKFTEKSAKENDLLGLRDEAIEKTSSSGYTSNHYFISASSLSFPSVYQAYIENQRIAADELKLLFAKDDPEGNILSIPMEFYSKEDKLPDQEIADNLAERLKQEEGLPKGNYMVTVYKNFIVNRVGLPDGENIDVEEIIK
ncbi:DUF1672 family protein [Listeria welshimeri]|uniref:Putative lipoprotein n=1 Tax=Listeria welshimeri serovar 6b (strain ATCC 35897 / DSM 20650 / CCUG 15529 / CIP 8149 / NCTC 11857 / SLCC 5334 / V8) TaxID=386043 RepID=A0AEQ8_LISW6|nr:DUF1672 family protein [Listeria welshimeri]MBC1452530.1 DUF1672 family protein [Listeria welshimeri]MBC1702638.1 DUF1672 family protein [Listeria welshimeri]MBC1785497.1 DUF1672 family protein [Listeria welshimeri]MBC2064999.1 DUF1672 family protein [Listeria welshimeri]MBC2083419.1 DUF1672 family protein [Listeria welshimeri]